MPDVHKTYGVGKNREKAMPEDNVIKSPSLNNFMINGDKTTTMDTESVSSTKIAGIFLQSIWLYKLILFLFKIQSFLRLFYVKNQLEQNIFIFCVIK